MNDGTAITIYTSGDQGATSYQDSIPSLEQSIEDWITESARSESQRTITTYRGIITGFRAHLQGKHLDLDHSPVAVAAVAREWLNAAQALRPGAIKAALASIDRSTAQDLRDYALLSVALTMGHRAGELAALRLKHLHFEGTQCTLSWPRRKGNEPMGPRVSYRRRRAFYAYLSDERVYGNRLLTMLSDSPIWLSFSDRNFRQAIGPRTISNMCERYLGTGKVHTTRHTAAVNLSHQKGVTLEQVHQFLGHKNAKTTSEYLREKQSYENPYGDQMEADFGIEA